MLLWSILYLDLSRFVHLFYHTIWNFLIYINLKLQNLRDSENKDLLLHPINTSIGTLTSLKMYKDNNQITRAIQPALNIPSPIRSQKLSNTSLAHFVPFNPTLVKDNAYCSIRNRHSYVVSTCSNSFGAAWRITLIFKHVTLSPHSSKYPFIPFILYLPLLYFFLNVAWCLPYL